MTGTLINVGGILAGSLIGTLLKKGIPTHINDAIMRIEGLAVGLIGLNGIIGAMFYVNGDGSLSDKGGLLLLISLVLGCLAGELIRINDRLDGLGASVEKRFGAAGFARGFISGTLIFSIGAMTIIGALNDGLTGDSSVLIVKAALDFTTAIILSASLGTGVFFSAVPVLVIQGGISLGASYLAPYITPDMLDSICMVGYAMVLCIGINFLLKAEIKVANLLPALVVPVIYHMFF